MQYTNKRIKVRRNIHNIKVAKVADRTYFNHNRFLVFEISEEEGGGWRNLIATHDNIDDAIDIITRTDRNKSSEYQIIDTQQQIQNRLVDKNYMPNKPNGYKNKYVIYTNIPCESNNTYENTYEEGYNYFLIYALDISSFSWMKSRKT